MKKLSASVYSCAHFHNGKLGAVVVPHRQRAGVGRPRRSDRCLPPSICSWLLVELVDQVARRHRERQIDRRRVDAERPVGQIARKRGIGVLALPHRRQMRQRLAVVVDLRVLRRCRVGDAVRARKQSVQIVEAAILGIDHDDVLDLVEPATGGGAGCCATCGTARPSNAAAQPVLRCDPWSRRPVDAAGQRWLPQLDLVAVGIDEPAKAPVLVLLDLADDLPAAQVHLTQRAVEIVDDQVEHELPLRRRKVIGVRRKRAADGEAVGRHRSRLELDRRSCHRRCRATARTRQATRSGSGDLKKSPPRPNTFAICRLSRASVEFTFGAHRARALVSRRERDHGLPPCRARPTRSSHGRRSHGSPARTKSPVCLYALPSSWPTILSRRLPLTQLGAVG